jgi:hypothetical protein
MTNKLLRSFIVAMFLMFGALSSAQAEMKCAPGKCGGQMQEQPKGMKANSNMGQGCPSNTKCNMPMQGKSKNMKCDMNASCPNNAKCDAKMKAKCTPKMKEKCAVDGKCPMQAPAKK